MCLGGKAKEQYNAQKSGDLDAWKTARGAQLDAQQQLAEGKITQQQADEIMQKNQGWVDQYGKLAKNDVSADTAMREFERQADVKRGRTGIDKEFTRFNDNYYNDYGQKYKDYYAPQLEQQYKDVLDKTMAALAARGLSGSSVGNNEYAELARQKAQAQTDIANDSVDAAKKLRGQVESAKSSLYATNEASANPEATNAQALGQATALVAPPTYSPLGQIFSAALSSLNNYQQAANNAPGAAYKSPYNSSKGSGSVIG